MRKLHAALAWVALECFLILAKSQGRDMLSYHEIVWIQKSAIQDFFKETTLQADIKINLGGHTDLINKLKVTINLKAWFQFWILIEILLVSHKYQTRFKSHQSLRSAILEFLFWMNDMKVCVKLVCFYSIFIHGFPWKWLLMWDNFLSTAGVIWESVSLWSVVNDGKKK